MVIPKVPREPLIFQDAVDCDYIRTLLVFWDPDTYNIIGDIAGYATNIVTTISGIVSIIEKNLKITNDIVDKVRAYGCFA